MGLFSSRILFRTASRIAIIAATGALSACSGNNFLMGSSAGSTQNLVLPDNQDLVGGAAYWGAKYEANRNDTAAALSFARNLRMMGGAKQAVTLLKEVVMKAPDDPRVLSEYGKALTAVGRVDDAIPFLSRSVQIGSQDWTTLSAYGVALDQTGNHKAARDNYAAALALSPNNPTIESNLAMSLVLDGQIVKGEAILRKLVARPDATAQMRQNLAMIATLRGNKAEAEQLVRQDLSPTDATNNLAVLRQFSAGNAKIDTPAPAKAPITAPKPTPVTMSAPTSAPNPLALPVPTKRSKMDPIEDAPLVGKPLEDPTKPKSIITPATSAATKSKPRAPVTMAPIKDDETVPTQASTSPPKPSPAKPATDQSAVSQPAALRQSMADDTLDETIELAEVAH